MPYRTICTIYLLVFDDWPSIVCKIVYLNIRLNTACNVKNSYPMSLHVAEY